MIIVTCFCMPIAQIMPDKPGIHEDTIDSLYMLSHSWVLFLMIIALIILFLGVNGSAINITKVYILLFYYYFLFIIVCKLCCKKYNRTDIEFFSLDCSCFSLLYKWKEILGRIYLYEFYSITRFSCLGSWVVYLLWYCTVSMFKV